MVQDKIVLPLQGKNSLTRVWNETFGHWEFNDFALLSKEDIQGKIRAISSIPYLRITTISFSCAKGDTTTIHSYDWKSKISLDKWLETNIPTHFKIMELCIFATFFISVIDKAHTIETITSIELFGTDRLDIDIYVTQMEGGIFFEDKLQGDLTIRPNLFTDQIVAWNKMEKRIVDISSVGSHNRAILRDLIARLCALLQTEVKTSYSDYLEMGMQLDGISENARPIGLI